MASDPTGMAFPQKKDTFCSPAYPTFNEEEFEALIKSSGSEDWAFPLQDGLEVHAGPQPNSPVVEKLGMHFVHTIQSNEQTPVVKVVTPSGKTNCMTDTKSSGGALACLVDLKNPPPRPQDAYGEWKGGWIDYDGLSVRVGSVHGDPGRFAAGSGPQLPYGQSLAFGDFRCRSDQAGLLCVNYAHQSAARFSDAGVETFGCLQPAPAPPQVGQMFSC